MKIQRKLALGYTIIVALIGGIVYTYLHEWRQMNRLEREVKEIHRLRQNVHEAYVHMLDLTMFGGGRHRTLPCQTHGGRQHSLRVQELLFGRTNR